MTRRLAQVLRLPFAAALLAIMIVGVMAALPEPGGGLAGTFGPRPAQARRIISPELDSPLQIRTGGLDVALSGPLECPRGATWEITATVTQGAATGSGRNDGLCKGDLQDWSVRATADGAAGFAPGLARGCAVLSTSGPGQEGEHRAWCNDIELVSARPAGAAGSARPLAWVAIGLGAVGFAAGIAALLRKPRPR